MKVIKIVIIIIINDDENITVKPGQAFPSLTN